MELRRRLERVPRPVRLFAVPVTALLIVGAVVLAGSSSNDSLTSVVPTAALGDFDRTPSPAASATAPLASTVEPPPEPNRQDCNKIRGTAYESEAEAAWYRANCTGGAAATAASGAAGGGLTSSSDRLLLPRLGINAPVNYRTIGLDGQMLDPAGPYDVVWYDFANFAGMGGYPGDGGNAVLAGHIDYRTVGAAVFWQLRNVTAGEVIQYRRADGQTITYTVTSVSDIQPGANWDPIVSRGGPEQITLITCVGEFNYTTREYSLRRVVKGVRN